MVVVERLGLCKVNRSSQMAVRFYSFFCCLKVCADCAMKLWISLDMKVIFLKVFRGLNYKEVRSANVKT